MRRIKVYLLKSFIKKGHGGNHTGVVLNADNLSEKDMKKIAKKIGFSETAFVQKSKKADFKVKFFSPEAEVPFCGHATIATFYLLVRKRKILKGKYKQETRIGLLGVEIHDKFVFMDQKLPVFSGIVKEKKVLKCLNINEDSLMPNLPIQIVSTGFPSILIPINSLKAIRELKPNLKKCRILSKKKLLIHAFTLETINKNSIAFSRNFFPIKSIDEETATGSSTGALACYFYKYNLLPLDKYRAFVFEQGHFMNSPSEILVKLTIKNKKIKKIQVGGGVMLVGEREVSI